MSEEHIEAYPLCWPTGWKRTPAYQREEGRFQGTPDQVRIAMVEEIERLVFGYLVEDSMAAMRLVISTNMKLRRDGMPYANQGRMEDPGVAVYFHRKGKQQCFACDKYDAIWKNMRAIQKTIEALRGIERWGSSDLLDRAFTGFTALPAPMTTRPWWEVLGVPQERAGDMEFIHRAYKELARKHHPDNGGSAERMAEINVAYDLAKKGGEG